MKYAGLIKLSALITILIITVLTPVTDAKAESIDEPDRLIEAYLARLGCGDDQVEDSQAGLYRRNSLIRLCRHLDTTGEFPFKEFFSAGADASFRTFYGNTKNQFMMNSLKRVSGDDIFCGVMRKLVKEYPRMDFSNDILVDNLKKAVSDEIAAKINKTYESFKNVSGIPRIRLSVADLHLDHDQNDRLYVEVVIRQDGDPVMMYDIPYIIKLKSGDEIKGKFDITDRRNSFEVDIPSKAISVEIDPNCEMFRYFTQEDVAENQTNPGMKSVFTRLVVCKNGVCTMQEL